MSILNVGELNGSTENNREIRMETSNNLVITGTLTQNRLSRFTFPIGTTAERPSSPAAGHVRYNTTLGYAEVYNGSAWYRASSGILGTVGTEGSPATNSQQLAGLPSGLYWFQPSGQTKYQMYVDNSRFGGGWVLMASVRTSTCQDHMDQGAVRISGTTGPRLDNTSTSKMADAWINAFVSGSNYTGSTRYWMEATGFNKNVFIDSNATVDLLSSASNQNARTRISNSYEGSLDDRGPNTGTRGFGDHHTSGGTYFAYGRHPESGNNCGFREDSLGASNGYLWVK
ncbi:hypothetical protein PRSM4_045 [Prochlorococcus phage P-RSM4]|uniref:Sericin 1-like protein n=1 Tax=Prochlorococcus phage P-RSM4 TaxID=444862 RepID=E3SLT1_9CAUD|nr:hypothetical protein PRSM4_045 [Prochlorococcus phage P-RSM4]ADO98429.1 hypothetical protein PRSM4_045 [Prochlorococcus phage P-RSM4]